MTASVDPHLALEALIWLVGWSGGYLPVFLDGIPNPWAWWAVPAAASVTARRLIDLDRLDSRHVQVGLPSRTQAVGPGSGTILWARVEGTEQLERARKFQPLPSLVLAEGDSSRRLLIWSLEWPLDHARLLRANKRLAYHFKGRQADGNPDALRIPLPGTFLRDKQRPRFVQASRLSSQSWRSAGEIVGRLRDPPEPRWQQRQAA